MRYVFATLLILLVLISGNIQATEDKELQTLIDQTIQAAEQGDADAQAKLGFMYHYGSGVPQSYNQAVEWYTKASEQGNSDAQYNLGIMYANGNGVEQDYKQAYAWSNIASAQNNKNAQKARDIISKSLDPTTLSEAKELSSKYYKLYVEPFQN